MTLIQLKRGQHAVIDRIATSEVPLKLMEMGCLPGATVTLVQQAPFKDPLYLNVNGTHLAIRRKVARAIVITPIDA